jgi:hypothetical protein
MSDTSDSQLDALLARCSRDVSPPQDLWPDIEARLSASRVRHQLPWRLAAGLAVLAVSAAIGSHFWPSPGRGAPASAPPGQSPLTVAFEAPRDASFQRTRAALELSYREQLAHLPPGTRVQVERDLDVIRSARDDLRRALVSNPESPLLQELFATAWQQEIGFYAEVAATSNLVPDRRQL